MRKSTWFFGLLIICLLGFTALQVKRVNAPAAKQTNKSSSSESNNPKPADTFSKSQYSLTDPTSIWVVVNKQHPLIPKDYIPSDLVTPNVPLRVPGNESMQLRQVTATAMETMFAAAKLDNIQLMLSSGYRSYTYQVGLYDGYVATQGQATADTQSARPGYSEHQTGLAADIEPVSKNCEVDPCFGNTPEGKWVAANAYKYGFIVRYTTGDESVTGYEAEPWHIRYVGVSLATELHKTGITTLEKFFGISGGEVYAN
jgi:D-alanyl-D-alanine carboxypeptidase